MNQKRLNKSLQDAILLHWKRVKVCVTLFLLKIIVSSLASMKLKETYDTLCNFVGGDKCASSLLWFPISLSQLFDSFPVIMEQHMGLYAFQLLQQKLSLTPDPLKSFLLININTGTHLQLDASATYALGVFDAGIDG